MKSISKFLLSVYLISGFCITLNAQNSTALFMLWQPSARSIAMGGAGTAIVDNSFAVFYNPAGLASNELNFVGSFVKPFPFLEHTIHSLTAISIPFKRFGVLGISANRFWKERQALTFETGPEFMGGDLGKSNFFESTHWEIKLSYAVSFSKNISAGINLSYLRIKLSEKGVGPEERPGKTFTGLFGSGLLFKKILPMLTWKPRIKHKNNFLNRYADNRDHAGISIGFSILNVGPKISFVDENQKDNPPTFALLGLAYWPISCPIISVLITTDLEKQVFESSSLSYLHLGNEIRLLSLFSIRTGYFLDTNEPRTSYFSIGGGIHLKFFSFNVARYKRSFLHTWHFDGTLSMEI